MRNRNPIIGLYYRFKIIRVCGQIKNTFTSFTCSGNGAKRRYRFKKPSEGGAYRKRQNLHEVYLLIILTVRDILKPRNSKKKKKKPLGMKILYLFLFSVSFKRKEEKKRMGIFGKQLNEINVF